MRLFLAEFSAGPQWTWLESAILASFVGPWLLPLRAAEAVGPPRKDEPCRPQSLGSTGWGSPRSPRASMPVCGPLRVGGTREGPGASSCKSQLGRARLLSEPLPCQTPAAPRTEALRAPSWEPERPGDAAASALCPSPSLWPCGHTLLFPTAPDSWTPDLTPAFNP